MDKERLEIKEEWKDIKGYEGCYQVSNTGKIKSFKHDKNGRILSPKPNGQYHQINLCKNGKCSKIYIHRLVAIHFILNPENKSEVNHIDGNKINNKASNLEWVTSSENSLHALEIGLAIPPRGESSGSSKLTNNEALSIYFLSRTGKFTLNEIGSLFDISFQTVSAIKTGERWRHVTEKARQALKGE